jgi:DNA-binding NarL/FixJ family response regulator
MISVVLASKLAVLREGMKRILMPQEDIDVIATVEHALDVMSSEALLRADVLVVVAHPVTADGQDYLLHLRQGNPALRVIIIARFADLQQIMEVIRAGVRGLLHTSCAANHLPDAIRAVSSGRLYMHEEVSGLLASGLGDLGKDHTHRSLTQREFEIFLKLAEGQKVSEIAAQLGISIKTVSTHKSRLMDKMGMKSQSQLIQYAVANKLFDTAASC